MHDCVGGLAGDDCVESTTDGRIRRFHLNPCAALITENQGKAVPKELLKAADRLTAMDSIFGFVGDGYVLLAGDCTAARSIIAYKHDEDKVRPLDTHKLLAAAGPSADCVRFTEYMQRNIALNEFRTGLKLSMKGASSYIRTELATAMRKNPYQVNMLIGGVDEDGPSIVFMDYLASAAEVNYGAQGYANFFVSSLFDRHWHKDMTLDEGRELAKMCIKEIRTRLIVSSPRFIVKIVTKDGIQEISLEGETAVPEARAAAGAGAAAPAAVAKPAGGMEVDVGAA